MRCQLWCELMIPTRQTNEFLSCHYKPSFPGYVADIRCCPLESVVIERTKMLDMDASKACCVRRVVDLCGLSSITSEANTLDEVSVLFQTSFQSSVIVVRSIWFSQVRLPVDDQLSKLIMLGKGMQCHGLILTGCWLTDLTESLHVC